MSLARPPLGLVLGALLAVASPGVAQRPSSARSGSGSRAAPAREELPLKYEGPATSAEISASDLMTRLYVFADDSMMGREVGTIYNTKGSAYIEREIRRLGLVPAGDSGGYFQNLPLYNYFADGASSMTIAGRALAMGTDVIPLVRAEQRVVFDGLPVVYGGSLRDSSGWLSSAAMAGRVVVLSVPSSVNAIQYRTVSANARFASAAAVLIVYAERVPAGLRPFFVRQTVFERDAMPPAGVPSAFITTAAAISLFGPMDNLRAGAAGSGIAGSLILHKEQAPARNVVGVIPGSDPKLRGQYVAIGAHNDHIGFTTHPVDHDSLRALNAIARPQGADSPEPARLTQLQLIRLRRAIDSLHARHSARADSIFNGADDDGTGSMSVLEIAEAFASAKVRPRRSLLFVWHAGEEMGMWGSEFYTDHPTVPRDSIVAQLNMDMVGRGAASDVTGETRSGQLTHGGPGYLQLIGSRRLSTELGDLIETVNRKEKLGFAFDYSMDANGHPQNIYCRSDHYEYARYGIPIVFLTTGGHADYHEVTDEPQYIDYPHMADVARLVRDVALAVANLDHRVVVDKPRPDPKGSCVQ
jgi:hypothetical protein